MIETKSLEDLAEISMYSEDEIKKAMDYLNETLAYLNKFGYAAGTRNNLAVDISCYCHVLEIDPMQAAEEAHSFTGYEGPDFNDRLIAIEPYLDGWDVSANGVFDYSFDVFIGSVKDNRIEYVVFGKKEETL
jgi:hypothetical protein